MQFYCVIRGLIVIVLVFVITSYMPQKAVIISCCRCKGNAAVKNYFDRHSSNFFRNNNYKSTKEIPLDLMSLISIYTDLITTDNHQFALYIYIYINRFLCVMFYYFVFTPHKFVINEINDDIFLVILSLC